MLTGYDKKNIILPIKDRRLVQSEVTESDQEANIVFD